MKSILSISIASLCLTTLACSAAPDAASSDDEEVKVCALGKTTEGVDVSHYQGDVDWASVKGDGVDFAFIRVSDGTNVEDTKFDDNWAGAKAAGVLRGAYQFFRPNQDPIAQADLLLSHISDLDSSDLAPALDVEVTGGMSGASVVSRANQWAKHVAAATGRTPIVYTAPGFWNGLGSSAKSPDVLWVANWATKCPTMPKSWKAWKFWQYTDSGSVSGISGHVDRDRFNGSLADLQAFAGQ